SLPALKLLLVAQHPCSLPGGATPTSWATTAPRRCASHSLNDRARSSDSRKELKGHALGTKMGIPGSNVPPGATPEGGNSHASHCAPAPLRRQATPPQALAAEPQRRPADALPDRRQPLVRPRAAADRRGPPRPPRYGLS